MMLLSLSMRLYALVLLVSVGLAEDQKKDAVSIQTATPDEPGSSEGPKSTTFNGIEVPPMKELNGEEFDKETKDGYWFVKHYSPYCHHCIAIAPTWQTLYEYYYTSKPPSTQSSKDTPSQVNPFHQFYNFHFASLDCVAYGSACEAHDVNAYPSFLLYKDGKMVKKFTGTKDLQSLSHFIEETLESIRPGSRPKEGVKLPEVGATSVDVNAKPDTPAAKDKDTAAGAAAGQKHNEEAQKAVEDGAATKTKTTTSQPDRASRPTPTPNPSGTVVPLTAESFQNLVTTTQDAWFVKFYAPWCPHCQAMAPNWAELGREMQGKLRIGEVNCDQESRLCRDVSVSSYPTIIFFKGGERVEYGGLRGLGDFLSFANKALDMGDEVKYVDAATFKEMEKTEEVIFLYLFDHATTSEDFAAIDRVRLSLIGHAKFVKSNDTILSDRFKISTWPRLLVSRDGRATYYTALAPREMRDYRKVLAWMRSVWLPIVPELTVSNAREIMDGRYVVLGILSRNRPDELIGTKREIKMAALQWMERQTEQFQRERREMRGAKQLRIEEAEDRGDQRGLRSAKSIRIDIQETDQKQVGFAWVDGVFWERWLRRTYGIDVAAGERVIVNDEDYHQYWDTTASGAPIMPTRTSILETLPKIVSSPPTLTPKSTTSRMMRLFYAIRRASRNHPYWATGLSLVLLIVFAVWGRLRMRRSRGSGAGGIITGSSPRGGFFKLDGKDGLLGSVVGLGGGQNGKVD